MNRPPLAQTHRPGDERSSPPGATRRPPFVALACAAVFTLVAAAAIPELCFDSNPVGGSSPTGAAHAGSDIAEHIARTGLRTAAYWLRRQSDQPVTRFAPSARDSIDPDIGLVREFALADGLTARFEVWRSETEAERVRPDPTQEDARRHRLGARDLSSARGHQGEGQVWQLHCASFVFDRPSPGEPFSRRRTAIQHRALATVDVARFGLRLPGQAALCVRDGQAVKIGARVRLAGGQAAAGIYFGRGDQVANPRIPTLDPAAITGTPAQAPTASEHYQDSAESLFGADLQTLERMADLTITDPDCFPEQLRPHAVYLARIPKLTRTSARPLRGGGVLILRGDLFLTAGSHLSAADFEGLLYVDGNLHVDGAATLRGAVVVTGSVFLQGGATPARILYDEAVLRTLRDSVGAYRFSTPISPSTDHPTTPR